MGANIADGKRSPLRRLSGRFFGGYNRDQKLFIGEAMLLNSANVITTGVFLTGLMLYMGASDLMVGLISSSGTWSLMLSLLSSVVVESVKRKKPVLAGVQLVFRLLTTLPVFLPVLLGRGLPTAWAASVMMIAGNLVFSVYNTGFFVFFMDSLPEEGRLGYIYVRMFWLRLAYTVFSVGMGALLQLFNGSYAGFVIVFCTALALGVADSVVLMRIRGNAGADARRGDGLLQLGPHGLLRRLTEPLKNTRYMRYLLFTFGLFFFFSMASSYTSLYQYKYLHLSVLFITIYNAFIYAIMIAVTGLWARLERRMGRLMVLVLSAVLMALDFLVYGFLTTQTLWVIVLSPVFNGLGSSGFWACALPYRYDLMPEEGKTVYEGWNGVFFGSAGLFGALAGGALQDLLRPVAAGFFSVFQILYLAAFVLSMASTAAFWIAARRDKAAPEPVSSSSQGVSV